MPIDARLQSGDWFIGPFLVGNVLAACNGFGLHPPRTPPMKYLTQVRVKVKVNFASSSNFVIFAVVRHLPRVSLAWFFAFCGRLFFAALLYPCPEAELKSRRCGKVKNVVVKKPKRRVSRRVSSLFCFSFVENVFSPPPARARAPRNPLTVALLPLVLLSERESSSA